VRGLHFLLERGPRLSRTETLETFLAGVERRAFKMAEYALGNRDDALDAVQEAMCALVERYATRAPDEWPPLFYRIRDTRITDEHRRRTTRRRWFSAFSQAPQDDAHADGEGADEFPATRDWEPEVRMLSADLLARLDVAIRNLPLRQRQVLLLRAWEGLDVRATAAALGCSEGAVKTHHFRALERLRAVAGEDM